MFARTLAIAASVALLSQVANAANKCVREYTVKEGDYCDMISAAQNVSTYQLAAINPGTINTECTNLQIGQTICLGTEGEDCNITHVVKPNDSCEEIFAGAKINGTIFGHNNPQINAECSNIYIGQVLCVADEVLVPPQPGVPIHTQPPTGVPLADPTATSSVVDVPAPTIVPVTTTAAPPAAVAPTKAAAAPTPTAGEDDEEEEDCEEYEVVEGDTDEDLPFCDELF